MNKIINKCFGFLIWLRCRLRKDFKKFEFSFNNFTKLIFKSKTEKGKNGKYYIGSKTQFPSMRWLHLFYYKSIELQFMWYW